jgi:hypothetical protein
MTDYDKPDVVSYDLHRELLPYSEKQFNLSQAINITFYERTAGQWKWNKKGLAQLGSSTKKKINKVIQEQGESISRVKKGIIRVVSSTIRFYQKQNLTDLFERNGFEVQCTFVLSKEGHIVHDADMTERGQQLGILVKRP